MARSNARLVRFGFLAALLILCGFILSKGATSSYSISTGGGSAKPAADTSNNDVDESEKKIEKPIDPKKPVGNNGEKVKATFVTLARNRDVYELVGSIREIEDRFNHNFHYDWVFLNDEEFDDEFKRITTAMVTGKTHYGTIPKEQWGFPEWIDTDKAAAVRKDMRERKIIYGDSISYRHMCRYESGFFFRHPLMEQFDYYWRVEPGIKIYCDIDYDVFKYFKDNNFAYGFTISLPEYKETIPTLWETTKKFIDENPQYVDKNSMKDFISDDGGSSYNGCHFWSNFEVGDLSLWRSEAYLKYFDYLDQAGGFFYERWGDAPVHSIAAALFLPRERIHFFDDVGYYHVPFHNCPVDQKVRLSHRCSCNPKDDFTFKGYSCVNRYYKVNQLKKPDGWQQYGD
ncbi:DEKNAAC101007 [Brettanomyces naardenensis]|uniref:DEKNAAC101007 n=1 Tax=Brettanomyces naardenensis TaxID=13370 RepID=A0A448YGZ9_BRENA|nr:DEKNAAC101007 [Brettanomyces naardenensis]